jgi:hypothetical protein
MNNDLQILYLNDVANKFLSLSDGQSTIQTIYESLLNIYDIDYNTLCNDILILIRDLQWNKIIGLKE